MPKPKLRGVYRIVKTSITELKKGDLFFLLEGKNNLLKDDRDHPDRFVWKAKKDGEKTNDITFGRVQCDSVDVK